MGVVEIDRHSGNTLVSFLQPKYTENILYHFELSLGEYVQIEVTSMYK